MIFAKNSFKSSLVAATYTYLIVQIIAILLILPSAGSLVLAIAGSYLALSFTICIPFTMLGFIFEGEQPLNPSGFAIAAFCSICILSLLYALKIFHSDARQDQKPKSNGEIRKVLRVIAALLLFASIAFPFFFPIDAF